MVEGERKKEKEKKIFLEREEGTQEKIS